jgi:hypothetical protein
MYLTQQDAFIEKNDTFVFILTLRECVVTVTDVLMLVIM